MKFVGSRSRRAQAEFQGAALPDSRLHARLETIVSRTATRPGDSLPKQSGTVAALEATYRFFGNERVTPELILAPHINATAVRARAHKAVLVVHDTTEFDFGKRESLGKLNMGRRGFLAHYSVAVTTDPSREILGVLNIETVFRELLIREGASPGKGGRQSERSRWYDGADRSAEALGETSAIHVCDREADFVDFMNELVKPGSDLVIRVQHLDRYVSDGQRVDEVSERMPVLAERQIELNERGRNPSTRARKRYPPRKRRVARVQISAAAQQLPISKKKSLSLNLVRVRELDAPAGEPPVDWLLWTSLPVETEENVLRVVDAYRARWIIEEFFKALKTGCAFEKLQLESRRSLLNALAVLTPIAWLLIGLRSTARSGSNLPASSVLSETQIVCLRAALIELEGKTLSRNLTARDALLAIARLGGHLKQNGEPGWIVLGRGMHDLLLFERGYSIARAEM